MSQPANRRKELQSRYKQAHPEAGVYRIVNTRTGKALLGSAANLASARNRFAFAQSSKSPGGLDLRLARDIAAHGLDAFTLEILETLQPTPEQTAADIRADLATLEALWREKYAPDQLY